MTVPGELVVGFNYPWSRDHYGWDFGPRLRDPGGVIVTPVTFRMEQQMAFQGQASALPLPSIFECQPGSQVSNLERNLTILRELGIQVVRIWLVANGLAYGSAPVKRKDYNDGESAGELANYDWAYTVPPRADPRYGYQFGQLLSLFKKCHMQILPSLLDFPWGGNSSLPTGPPGSPQDTERRGFQALGLAPGGRSDCFKDARKTDLLLGTLLTELLAVAAAPEYKGVVYAFEVINEPAWNVLFYGKLGTVRCPEATIDQMNHFLDQACRTIQGYGLASTVGHRFYQDIIGSGFAPRFAVTGSKPQFHYYARSPLGLADPPQIKGSWLFQGIPIPKPFLGEFDSAQNRHGNPWWELKGNDTTLYYSCGFTLGARMRPAREQCGTGAALRRVTGSCRGPE